MTLPKDIAPALTDGVVLCHLANYIRPRSVATIHVPSPAVVRIQYSLKKYHNIINIDFAYQMQPKLTMARCRRNVDNFLDACRRIGVDEVSSMRLLFRNCVFICSIHMDMYICAWFLLIYFSYYFSSYYYFLFIENYIVRFSISEIWVNLRYDSYKNPIFVAIRME